MKPEKNENQLQEKYMEFQVLQQQMEQVSKYLEELDGKVHEFVQTRTSLKKIAEMPLSEAFVSLAPGIFAQAEMKENQKFIVNVGANVMVEKTVPQISEMLDRQIKEISQVQIQMDQNLQSLNTRINELVKELS